MGPVRVGQRPAVFGHRGGDRGPENSLEAIRSSVEAGADGVEIDVQVLPDGQVVLGHDPIDSSLPTTAERVTLADLLETVGELRIQLLIDFKSVGDPSREAAVMAAALVDHKMMDNLIISSFSVPFLLQLRSLAPNLELLPIVSLRQNFPHPVDQDSWSGMSVLAAALLANPLLAARLQKPDRRLLVWFGATEWSFVIRLVARLGAEVLIVSKIVAARRLLGFDSVVPDTP